MWQAIFVSNESFLSLSTTIYDIDRNYALLLTLNLNKWPWIKFMTSLRSKAIFMWSMNFHCFSKRQMLTGPNFAIFLPMTLNFLKWHWVKSWYTWGHKQSLCEVWTSNVSPKDRYGLYTITQMDRQTNRRTRWFLYIPKHCLQWGIIMMLQYKLMLQIKLTS